MKITALFTWFLYVIHAIFLPLFLIGIIKKGKAKLQNRQGPSIFQPFWDLLKLFKKSETVSNTTTFIFHCAPLVNLGAIVAVAAMVPWLGMPSPMSGNIFLIIYILALGKFFMGLLALDAGSTFGGIGASREAAISILSEPILLLALGALATEGQNSSLSILLAPNSAISYSWVVVLLVVAALWFAVTAELSRMPVDDPATHLELTMIHEAMILENSGRNLAIVEYAVALKTSILLGLVAQVALILFSPYSMILRYIMSISLLLLGASIIIVTESILVKLQWRITPHFLVFGLAAGLLACLLAAIRI